MCGNNLSIYGVHIPWKCIEIESMDFCSCPTSPIKTPGRIFWKSASPQDEKGGGNYDLLYQKLNQKISRWPGKFIYLYFVQFVIFLNVMALVLWIMSLK